MSTASPLNWTKESIMQLGEAFARRLGYKIASDLSEIVSSLGGTIQYQNMSEWLKSKAEAIHVKGPHDFTIYLADFTGILRDRFTIVHELGHYIMHSKSGEVPLVIYRRGSDRLEWEANWFAAAFLMPEKKFRDSWNECNDASALASQFLVSLSAAKIRAVDLGLFQQP